MDIEISLDNRMLNLEMIHNYLSQEAYWAEGRSLATVVKSISNSVCDGMYHDGIQIGFGRVVTDYAVFGWIMDVFIVEEHRGKGLGKLMIHAIMNHPELDGISRWGLTTKDAHGLYEQFGFVRVGDSATHMELLR